MCRYFNYYSLLILRGDSYFTLIIVIFILQFNVSGSQDALLTSASNYVLHQGLPILQQVVSTFRIVVKAVVASIIVERFLLFQEAESVAFFALSKDKVEIKTGDQHDHHVYHLPLIKVIQQLKGSTLGLEGGLNSPVQKFPEKLDSKNVRPG